METLNNLISINFDYFTVVLLVVFFTAENVFDIQFKFDIFILWSRIFGTFKYKHPDEVILGLKEFDDRKQSFWYLLKTPFIHIPRHNPDKHYNQNEY